MAPPPGATSRPTVTPAPVRPTATFRPLPSPSASPTLPLPPGCQEILSNGDFEKGPIGWGYASWQDGPGATDPSTVIRRSSALSPPIQSPSGSWLVGMRDRVGVQHLLYQRPAGGGVFAPGQIVSAALSYRAARTTAVRDGTASHALLPAFMNAAEETDYYPVAQALTEEVAETDTWYEVGPLDVTHVLTRRPGWDAAIFMLIVPMPDDPTPVEFLADDISLRVCLASPLAEHLRLSPQSLWRQAPWGSSRPPRFDLESGRTSSSCRSSSAWVRSTCTRMATQCFGCCDMSWPVPHLHKAYGLQCHELTTTK